MNWKQVVGDYFSFTRKERIGVVVLLVIISLSVVLPFFFSDASGNPQLTDSSWAAIIKTLDTSAQVDSEDYKAGDYRYYQPQSSTFQRPAKTETFYFDPNTASVDQWRRLGMAERTIRTIQNYLAKGGRFRSAEDLQRIYGFRDDDFRRLASWVRFAPGPHSPGSRSGNERVSPAATSRYNAERRKPLSHGPIDINTADTSAFISLPGIGSKLASRIVLFREKLGGFHHIDQVRETFGLPDSTFQKIKTLLAVNTTAVRKININTATIDELKVHPYFRQALANAIVVYRDEHGQFSSVEELKKVMIVTDEIYKKILPYLVLN